MNTNMFDTVNVIEIIDMVPISVYPFENTDKGIVDATKCFKALLNKHYEIYHSEEPKTRWLNNTAKEGIYIDYDNTYSIHLVQSTLNKL